MAVRASPSSLYLRYSSRSPHFFPGHSLPSSTDCVTGGLMSTSGGGLKNVHIQATCGGVSLSRACGCATRPQIFGFERRSRGGRLSIGKLSNRIKGRGHFVIVTISPFLGVERTSTTYGPRFEPRRAICLLPLQQQQHHHQLHPHACVKQHAT
ncbi:hypothetical protein AG1IA_01028 [Rhizoctonia solani AG-1 IA]|uniref:Uncharacterized protein n=1 Tax=Thanatephorus cucumeris (strain AG1-IA) TaxID=983506 RepID=L8X770_THACA|nr:hypothetical protein AG1IA_01028 [Rhizoctonia solani AG-1 IA]